MSHYSDYGHYDSERRAAEAADLREQALAKLPPEKREAITQIDAMLAAYRKSKKGINQTMDQFFSHLQGEEEKIMVFIALVTQYPELFADQKHIPVERHKGHEGVMFTDRSMDLG